MIKKLIPQVSISFFKRLLFTFVIIAVTSIIQFYWAMGDYADRMSSACLDCGFFEDLFLLSIFTAVLLSIIFIPVSKIRNVLIKAGVYFIILAAFWMFFDYTIFVERESSWSTYSFESELFITVYHSLFPVSVLGAVAVILLNYNAVKSFSRKS